MSKQLETTKLAPHPPAKTIKCMGKHINLLMSQLWRQRGTKNISLQKLKIWYRVITKKFLSKNLSNEIGCRKIKENATHTLNCLWKCKKQTLVLKILCGNSCTFAAGRWGTFIMFLFKNFSLVPVKPILAFDKKFGEILKVFIHFQLMDFHSPLSNSSKQNNLVLRTWSEQFCPVS